MFLFQNKLINKLTQLFVYSLYISHRPVHSSHDKISIPLLLLYGFTMEIVLLCLLILPTIYGNMLLTVNTYMCFILHTIYGKMAVSADVVF